MPQMGLPRPRRGFRRRRRAPVPTQIGGLWDDPPPEGGPGPGDGGGLAGVREPRRPKPAPPSMSAALPLPEDEAVH